MLGLLDRALAGVSGSLATLTVAQQAVLVPALLLLLAVAAAWLDVQRKTVKPTLTYQSTRFSTLSRMLPAGIRE